MKIKQLLFTILLLSNFTPSYADTFVGLFGDLTVQDSKNAPFNSDSYGGVLDFYVTHQFNNKTTGLLELVYDDTEGEEEVEIERLWLQRLIVDKFNLSVGRFHSRLGSWNKLINHAALLQDTISSPFFLELRGGGGVFPLHVIGLMAEGTFGSENVSYMVMAHGSQEINAVNNNGRFVIKPEILFSGSSSPGYSARILLKNSDSSRYLSGFMMQTDVSLPTGFPVPTAMVVSQLIVGLDVGQQLSNWKITAEYFYIRNDVVNSVASYPAGAYFIQTSYLANERIKLTYRYAGISVDDNDPYFQVFSMTDQSHHVADLRYDINDEHAIKFELDYVDFSDSVLTNTLTYKLQWAFLFD